MRVSMHTPKLSSYSSYNRNVRAKATMFNEFVDCVMYKSTPSVPTPPSKFTTVLNKVSNYLKIIRFGLWPTEDKSFNLEILNQLVPRSNSDGKIPLHNASLKYRQKVHREFEKYPEVLDKIYAKKDDYGLTPLMGLRGDDLKEVFSAYHTRRATLGKLMLLQNEEGKTSLHIMNIDDKMATANFFRNYPEIWAKMNLVTDYQGKCPISSNIYGSDFKQIHHSLSNQPDVLLEVYKRTRNFDESSKSALRTEIEKLMKTIYISSEDSKYLTSKYLSR